MSATLITSKGKINMVENQTKRGTSLTKEQFINRLYNNKSIASFSRLIDKEGSKECKKVINTILTRNIEGINKMLEKQAFANTKTPRVPVVRLTAIDYQCIKRWFLYCTPTELQDAVKAILTDNIIYMGMQTGITEYKATKLNRADSIKVTQIKTSVSTAFNSIAHLVYSKVMEVK